MKEGCGGYRYPHRSTKPTAALSPHPAPLLPWHGKCSKQNPVKSIIQPRENTQPMDKNWEERRILATRFGRDLQF